MLEKLFTSKNRIKILGYFFFEKNPSYIRQISNELGISPSAVKGEIENLVEIGLLKNIENEITLNEECNFLSEIKSIFLKTDFLVIPIKNCLKGEDIKFALVFGSFAKGNFSEESDVDLLVVGDVTESKLFKILKKVEEKIRREINPVVWNEKDFVKKKNERLGKEIFANKFILIKGDENEFQRFIGK